MTELPQCPKCASAYTYVDGHQYVCPECAHEWPREAATAPVERARVSEFVKKST